MQLTRKRHARSAAPPHSGGPRRELVAGVLLALAVFAAHIAFAHKLDAFRILERYNTLFGADPHLRFESLQRPVSVLWLSHPALHVLYVVPVRALSRLVALVAPGTLEARVAAREIALLIAPALAALQCFVLLRLFRRLGFTFAVAALFALLDAVSFSTIFYGSMPETFAASSLAIALAYALFLRTRDRRDVAPEFSWFALEAIASGITITNIIPIGVLHLLRETHARGRSVTGVLRVGAVAGLALATAVGVGWGSSRLLRVKEQPAPLFAEWIHKFVIEAPGAHLATFPTAIVNGVVPPVPLRIRAFLETRRVPLGTAAVEAALATARGVSDERGGAGVPGDHQRMNRPNAPFRMTFEHSRIAASPRNILGIILVLALAWAAVTRRHGKPLLASLARASLAIVVINWVFHGFWGDESFLYSMHWQVPLIVLLATLVAALRGLPRVVIPLLALGVVAVLVRNVLVVREILSWFSGR